MKPKVRKTIRNALMLSIIFHVLLVFALTGLYQSERSPMLGMTHLDIFEVRSQRALRPLKRKKYTPPKDAPIRSKQIQVNVTSPAASLSTPQPIVHRNPIIADSEPTLPNTITLGIGNSVIDSATPTINQGIGTQSGVGKFRSPVMIRRTKQQSLKSSIDDVLPQVSDLPMPNVILARVGQHIVANRTTDIVDVVFIIDASGSMKDNIDAIRTHLNRMTEQFDAADIDFTLGIAVFRANILGLDFELFPQTRSVLQIKRMLAQVRCRGGEKTLDALIRAADEVVFRQNADVHFILITDEYVNGNYSAKDVLAKMKQTKIKVDVVGRDEPFQKFIARSTGGLWLPISSLGAH